MPSGVVPDLFAGLHAFRRPYECGPADPVAIAREIKAAIRRGKSSCLDPMKSAATSKSTPSA